MADRINTDECISRVYQFLNKQKDWQKAADITGDGTITRTEFSAFILNSGFKFNGGESKADLIAAFWKSIDVNVKGKVDIGRISNKNALDSKELATVEKNMEAESKVDSFIRTNYVCPSGLENNKERIRESVKAGILNRAIELLNNGGDISELTDSKLQEFYQSSMNKATADYKAIAMIDEKVKQKYGNEIDYKSADDEVRADIIDDYISQLNGTETQEQVSKDVEAIVNAYMDTAETNSTASTNLLAKYGYDPMDDLNPLQVAVLTKDLTEKVLKYLQSSNSDIVTGAFKDQAVAMVKAFVEEYLKDKRADEFTKIKNIDVSSSEFASLETQIKENYNKLQEAIGELQRYIDGILKENNERKNQIIKDVMHVTDVSKISDELSKMTDINKINEIKSEIEVKLAELDTQIAAEEAANAEKYKARFTNLAGLIDDIHTESIGLMTDGKSTIHTEFGVDASGNIVFEQPDTTTVYNQMKSTLKAELKKRDKESYETVGDSNIDKLIQAAWIMAYNKNNSSETHSTAAFISDVLSNFESILTKLKDKPEYLAVYTGHTAYANSKLTSNLIYYGKENATDGNDNIWVYEGSGAIASDGGITWDDATDAGEYRTEMHILLENIKRTEPYKNIDQDLITSIFREAQEKAIKTCQSNVNDCPYGTTSEVDGTCDVNGFWPWSDSKNYNPITQASVVATENQDWAGVSREGDKSKITVDALVQLTLYYFDKLLYAKLAE